MNPITEFDIPEGPIPADLGDGPAVTVHLLPNVVECREVVFAAADVPMDNEGYWIDLNRLRRESDWAMHLSSKITRPGNRPAVEMLADALARKTREMEG